MRELSVYTGGGLGIWGSKLLGWKPVGYVEVERDNQKIIAQRIKEGHFEEAPIFGDIRSFINNGYANAYQGMVDVLSAGFPCPAFSLARHAHVDELPEDNDKNLWPETIECIRIIRPKRAVWLENVPSLLAEPYFGRILSDLAEAGYNARWTVLGVDDCGGSHIRKRLWIQAYPSNTSGEGLQRWEKERDSGGCGSWSFEHFTGLDQRQVWAGDDAEPGVVRGGDGHTKELNKRIRACGNGQSPIVMAEAWRILSEVA